MPGFGLKLLIGSQDWSATTMAAMTPAQMNPPGR